MKILLRNDWEMMANKLITIEKELTKVKVINDIILPHISQKTFIIR